MCDSNTSSIILVDDDLVDTTQQLVESVQQQQSEQAQIVENNDGSGDGDGQQYMDNESTSSNDNLLEKIFLQLNEKTEVNIIEDDMEIVSLEDKPQHHLQEEQIESVEEIILFNEIQGEDIQDLDKLSQRTEPDIEILNLNTNIQENCISNIVDSILEQDNSSQQWQDNTSPNASLLKDYMKDSAEMEWELDDFTSDDNDFDQVLKGFESVPAGEAVLCDSAGSLPAFNDDVIDSEIKDQIRELKKTHHQLQRKHDFLLRRLRKIQVGYISKHTCEEIAGLFEWTGKLVARKDREHNSPLSGEDERHKPTSIGAMKLFLERIKSAAAFQHSYSTTPVGEGTKRSNKSSRSLDSSEFGLDVPIPSNMAPNSLISQLDNRITTEIGIKGKKRSNKSSRSLDSSEFGLDVPTPTNMAPNSLISQLDNRTTTEIGIKGKKRSNKSSRSLDSSEFGLDLPTPSNMAPNSLISQLDDRTTKEIERVASMLQTELKSAQSALDSEATASSSDDESFDEMGHYNNVQQQTMSIANRAAWRWARDRSAIASRWHWLLQQISILEYRIRHHDEQHRQIKKTKGSVKLEKSMPMPSFTAEAVGATVMETRAGTLATAVASAGVTTITKVVVQGNSKALDCDNVLPNLSFDANGGHSDAARTRPVSRIALRKRKLLQTANIHTISKIFARPSTIKCGCQWPLQPCSICTGRRDPTAPRGLPDTMSFSERIALLDSSFHPVLSFPEEVGYGIHSESVLRLPEWQKRVKQCLVKKKLMRSRSSQKGMTKVKDRSNKKLTGTRRKYNRKSSQGMAANKLKNAKIRRTRHGNQFHHSAAAAPSTTPTATSTTAQLLNKKALSRKLKKNVFGTMSLSTLSDRFGGTAGGSLPGSDGVNNNNIDGNNISLRGSKNASPITGYESGGNSSGYKYKKKNRKNRTVYEYGKIVIPTSALKATKIDVVTCKEIQTPIWRIVDDDDNDLDKTITKSLDGDDEIEDISDEAMYQRHERALIQERKNFETYWKFATTRSRANRRLGIRAELTGANPPAPNTPSVSGDQELTSSAENLKSIDSATATPATTNNQLNNHPVQHNSARSTISNPRDIVPPHEVLSFPLSDDVYDAMIAAMPRNYRPVHGEERLLNSGEGGGGAGGDTELTIGKTRETFPVEGEIGNEIIPVGGMCNNCINNNNLNNSSETFTATHNNFEEKRLLDVDTDTDSTESSLSDEKENSKDPDWRRYGKKK